MTLEAVSKATANLTKAIGDAAIARVEAERHRRQRDNFERAADHRRAVENARVMLEHAIEATADMIRNPPKSTSPQIPS